MIRILTSLVAVLTVGSVHAQAVSPVKETPKLVIGITIDQLRSDYLDIFQGVFSERGFKRLLNEGLVYKNVEFDIPNLDEASAIATIYTGTTPFYHGITGNNKYLPKAQRESSTFADENYLGNYTQEKLSPLAIKASTIADELKLASGGLSDVYSFAPNAASALVGAGRAANCAFWVEDYSGTWASSTYYRDFYWVVDQENRSNNSISAKALGMTWSPLLDISRYKAFPYAKSLSAFQHNFGTDTKTAYKRFKQSPYVNESVVDVVTKVMAKASFGSRTTPDFLALTLYAGHYSEADNYSAEIQDTYIRLDKQIERLLDEVDRTVGLKNTFIFVTSTGYYNYGNDPQSVTLNDGTFYINRCQALLNMYLMAIYGKEQWVDRFYNGQIYLNRKLIEDKHLSLQEIQEKSADFVAEFTGVQEVYTSYQLQRGQWNPAMDFYRNGYTKETSGDLFVELQPGYKVVVDDTNPKNPKVVRGNAVPSPLIFFGGNVKAEKISRTIKATQIAPSVTHVLRIRPPNAAKELPLAELY